MTTVISPHCRNELILVPGDCPRLPDICRALGGRWVPASKGFALRPARARKVRALWRAGAFAIRSNGWRFKVAGVLYDRYSVVRVIQ